MPPRGIDLPSLADRVGSYHAASEALDQLVAFVNRHPTALNTYEVVPSYVYDNGSVEKDVIKLVGGVSIVYNNHRFKLPCFFILPHRFPKDPPLVYMSPNRDMVRNDRSPHVDANFRVVSAYLDRWSHPFSSLDQLYDDMRQKFGESPPLKKPSRTATNAAAASSGPPPSYVDALHEHVNTQLDLEYTYLSEKLEGEKTRRGGLEERMATLEAEKGAVERKISEVRAANDALDAWLAREEETMRRCRDGGGVDAYEVVMTGEAMEAMASNASGASGERPAGREAMEAAACVRAVQDAVRLLDARLADGSLGWGSYKRMLSQLAAYKFHAKVVMTRGVVGRASLEHEAWAYPAVVGALDDEGDGGDGGALGDSLGGAALASNVLLGENPLRRGRFKDLLSSSRVFRSMP